MKRIIAIILAALFVVVMLASCGAKGKYVIYMVGDEKIDKEDQDDYPMIELKSGNKYVIYADGSEIEEGTWKKKGNKITMTDENDYEETVTYKGGKLYFDDLDVVYKKK